MLNFGRNEIEVGTVDVRIAITFVLCVLTLLDENHSN